MFSNINNLLSIIKDIIISVGIAIVTSGLFEVSNIIYQSIITVLILIIIFLILRGIDKKAKQLEVLSILYVEQFLVPFMESIEANGSTDANNTVFKKVKVFIILPKSISEIAEIRGLTMKLDRFNVKNNENKRRSFYTVGKIIDHDSLSLFDTPMTWIAGLEHLRKAKGMSDRKISRLLLKMTEDIKLHAKKISKDNPVFKNLNFISLSEYKNYYS